MIANKALLVIVFVGLVCLVASQSLNPSVSYSKSGADWTGTCQTGKSQSPIDVYEGTSKKVSINDKDGSKYAVEMHYHRIKTDACGNNNVTFVNNGNDIEINGDIGYVEFGGCEACGTNKYQAKKLVFRSPSEHTVDGKNMDMELQILHQKEGSSGNKDLLMVSVLFQLKSTPGGNPFLESIEWGQSPTNSGAQHVIKSCVDLNRISYSLEDDYYAYSGSLTAPPCDENVPWLVMTKTQGISTSELSVIANAFKNNKNFAGGQGDNRKVQPLNGRTVYYVLRHPPTSKEVVYDMEH